MTNNLTHRILSSLFKGTKNVVGVKSNDEERKNILCHIYRRKKTPMIKIPMKPFL